MSASWPLHKSQLTHFLHTLYVYIDALFCWNIHFTLTISYEVGKNWSFWITCESSVFWISLRKGRSLLLSWEKQGQKIMKPLTKFQPKRSTMCCRSSYRIDLMMSYFTGKPWWRTGLTVKELTLSVHTSNAHN